MNNIRHYKYALFDVLLSVHNQISLIVTINGLCLKNICISINFIQYIFNI